MTVTRDATSGRYVPASPTEWTALLNGTTITNPTSLWLLQESAQPFADSIDSDALSGGGPFAFQQAYAGWSRKGFTTVDSASYSAITANTLTGSSRALFMWVAASSAPGAQRNVAYMGNGLGVAMNTSGNYMAGDILATPVAGIGSYGTTVHPVLYVVNNTLTTNVLYTDLETITGNAGFADANTVSLGNPGFAAGGIPGWYGYGALWTGALAEFTTLQAQALIGLMMNGPASSGGGPSIGIGAQIGISIGTQIGIG